MTNINRKKLKELMKLADLPLKKKSKKIAAANAELTEWIQAHPDEAQRILISELKEETRSDFAPDAVAQAWKRIKFTTEVSRELVAKAVQDGKDAGFLKGETDTSRLIENP